MSEDNKNIKQYSSADIQKYLQGKLSAAEMHAMEKAAMDDPFLADAMEGMQNNFAGEKTFDNDIEALKKRLAEKVEEKNKIIPISPNRMWLRIAAAVVVLLGASGLMYNYFGRSSFSKENMAATRQQVVVADSAIQQNKSAPAASEADTISKSDIAEKEKPAEKKGIDNEEKQIAAVKKENKKNNTVAEEKLSDVAILKKPEPQKENDKAAETKDSTTYNITAAKPVVSNAPAQLKTDSLLQGKVAGVYVRRDKAKYQNSFSGKVLDANKQPIVGASVLLKNKKTGATTDNNGNFKLNTNDKDSVINVVVNSVGFTAATTTLNSNNVAGNVIELQPATNALNEVVVVGYGTQKKDSTDEDDTTDAPRGFWKQKIIVQKAIPEAGWKQYDNYLDSNKKINTADSTIKGKEIISFTVNKKGERSDFKIEQSLSPAHDAEAIRLVKEGPAWHLLKGKKARATLIIQF